MVANGNMIVKRERWSWLVHYFSAEWLLNRRPNGGDVIFARALLVATWGYALALLSYNVLDPQRTCVFNPRPCVFHLDELLDQIVNNFHWFGTVFAAVYVALYARFASQWTYLANLYNQIKGAEVRMSRDWANRKPVETLAAWKAAFLEDAEAPHLATKGSFVAVVKTWGEDPRVAQLFIQSTYRGRERFERLMTNVAQSYAHHDAKFR